MKLRIRSGRPTARTPDDQMTLTEHLAELRMRIIRSLLAIAVGTVVVLVFYNPILRFLRKPYERACEQGRFSCTGQLVALGPLDGFSARVRIATYGGLILAIPVLAWQLWKFIVPGLHQNERRYAVPFLLSAIALFLFGGLIAWFTFEPALSFLIGFSGDDVEQVYPITKYIGLLTMMFVAFGVGFEVPVLLVFLQLVGVLDHRRLLQWWRYALVLIVVVAAVITPSGDPISLAALSIPMGLLYFVAVFIGWLWSRRRARTSTA
jgi:sec-independent protein translocase protein TatC